MKVCLVGHNADGLRRSFVGGSEKQIALLARHLARRGHEVTFVVVGYSGVEERINGVHIRSGWLPGRGIRGIRFFTYRIPHLRHVLHEVAADVYYTRGGSFNTAAIISIAKRRGAVSILGLASDRDLYPDAGKILFAVGTEFWSSLVGPLAHRYFRRHGLQAVDWVIAQNAEQAACCKALGLSYQVIPSITELPPSEIGKFRAALDVLWVGNIASSTRRSKGFSELVTLCEMMPDVRFEIVGRLSATSIQTAMDDLKSRPNVHLSGPLPSDDLQNVMAHSKVLINTSPSEGFSNVMLEAWALGKPVSSLHVNPNGLLRPGGLGYCASGDLSSMAMAIRRCLEDESERRAIAVRCIDYIATEHAPEVVCPQYESLFIRKKNGQYQ